MAEAVREDFGGEERTFLVRIGELRKIQTACNAGPGEIAQRLARCVQTVREFPQATIYDQVLIGMGSLYVDDVREPILQGLIAGGMTSADATKLVRQEIDERGFRGLMENAALALALVIAGVSMPAEEADAPGEFQAGTAPPPGSTSEGFTPPEEPSESSPMRSTSAASGSSLKPSEDGEQPKVARKRPNRQPSQSTTL